MRLLSPNILFAVGLRAVSGHSQDGITPLPTEVCESKTINYITHTLPQQCLRTNWSSANATDQNHNATATATETKTGTGGETAVETGTRTEQAGSADPTAPSAAARQDATADKKEDGPGEDKSAKEAEDDAEDLATSSFMSFEEWKAMMLQKSGQDPADLKERKQREGRDGAGDIPNDSLDNWGDDGEIALDFDVLSDKISEMTATASARVGSASGDVASPHDAQDPAVVDGGVAHYNRPKDAGKTCKERFSFSSFDGGATVLKTSPGVKNPKAILVENKDSYMLFTCSQENKFVIVELSEDILVDTVVLANFEFFSSMIRSFRVSVSDKYPVKMEKWKDLGTFQARNSRDIQAFLIPNPKIWAKYIRIELLSHYGNEYYCPVSLLRVHGTRMMDSWKDAEAGADSDDEEPMETVTGPEAVPEQAVPQEETPTEEPAPVQSAEDAAALMHNDSVIPTWSSGTSPWYTAFDSKFRLETCSMGTPTTTQTSQISPPVHAANDITPPVESIPNTKESEPSTETVVSSAHISSTSTNTSTSSTHGATNTTITSPTGSSISGGDTAANKTQSAQQSTKSPSSQPSKAQSGSKTSNDTPSHKQQSKPSTANSSHTNKTATPTTPAAAASPTVQESFFKSVSKRLQFLESNTTLSLQYIEDQSRFLQEALTKMERRQIARVDSFLTNLNNTVLGELRNVRQQYDQIWQSTVLALETQREHSDREIIALSSRLNLLADEVVFQKRMAIFQSILLMCCLLLVLFSRGILGSGGAGSSGSSADWSAMMMPSRSQFLNTYLGGSPRWPPGSPPSGGSRVGTPTKQQRTPRVTDRASNLHTGEVQRSVSGPAVSSSSVTYADKSLPLTPTSDTFDSTDLDTPTPSKPSPPSIRVDKPESEEQEESLNFNDGETEAREEEQQSDEDSEREDEVDDGGDKVVSSVEDIIIEEERPSSDDDDQGEVQEAETPCDNVSTMKTLPPVPEDP